MTVDLSRLMKDLEIYADISEVRFDDSTVESFLGDFEKVLPESIITVRTTTEILDAREVNFRYTTREGDDDVIDPIALLRDTGRIAASDVRVNRLVDELAETFPVWWGVDVSVGRGFQKVWAFFGGGGVPLVDILKLKSLPESVVQNAAHLRKFGMRRVNIIAVDSRNQTVNLYSPIIPPGDLGRDVVVDLITDLGLVLPGEEELQRNAEAVEYYYTFSWHRPGIHRVCFAMNPPREEFPTHWHPLAEKFLRHAPFQGGSDGFIFNTTYGKGKAGYLKMETDYTGDAKEFWSRLSR
jgi:hypothetical protein